MNQPNTTTIPVFTIREIRRMARRQLSGKWFRALPAMLLYVLLVSLPSALLQIGTYLTSDVSAVLEMSGETGASAARIADDLSVSLSAGTVSHLNTLIFLLSLYIFITAGPFSLSLSSLCLRILRKQNYSAKTVFSGFSAFGKGFLTYFLITVFSFLWTLVFMVPGSMVISTGLVINSSFAVFLTSMLFFIIVIALLIFLMRYELSFFIAADENITAKEAVSKSVRLMKGNVSNYFLMMLSFLPWILLTAVPVAFAVITFFLALTEGSAVFSVLSVVLTLVSIVCYALRTLYMKTTSAVFYSGITGNFRSVPRDSENRSGVSSVFSQDNADDADGISVPSVSQDPGSSSCSETDAGGGGNDEDKD